MNTMTISESPAGMAFRVLRVVLGGEVGKRLADMGFTEGATGEVIRCGFMRGPMHLRIRGYDLILRRSEAWSIEIEPTGEWRPGGGHGRRWGRGRAFARSAGNGGGHGR